MGVYAIQDGSSDGIYAQRYNAAGTPQGLEFPVNTYTTSYQRNASVAMDSDGDFVIAWQSSGQDGSLYGVHAQRYNSSGATQSGEIPVNSFTTGIQRNASIAIDSDGDFVITWNSDGQDGDSFGVYGQRFNATGVAQGAEFQVNTYTTNSQSNPSIANDSDGDFGITWQSSAQEMP